MGAIDYIKHYKIYQTLNSNQVIAEKVTIEEAMELLDATAYGIEKAVCYGSPIKGYSIDEVSCEYTKNPKDTKINRLLVTSGWDSAMYEYRKKHGLDLTHWNEFHERQAQNATI